MTITQAIALINTAVGEYKATADVSSDTNGNITVVLTPGPAGYLPLQPIQDYANSNGLTVTGQKFTLA